MPIIIDRTEWELTDFNLTGITYDNSNGVLIGDDLIAGVWHSQPSSPVVFKNSFGNLFTYSIIESYNDTNGLDDMSFFRLDRPVDPSVKRYDVLDPGWLDEAHVGLADWNDWGQDNVFPAIFYRRNTNSIYDGYLFREDDTVNYLADSKWTGGDSGSPTFLRHEGELYFSGNRHYANGRYTTIMNQYGEGWYNSSENSIYLHDRIERFELTVRTPVPEPSAFIMVGLLILLVIKHKFWKVQKPIPSGN